MHYLLLITLTMQPGATSLEARCRVRDLLLEDPTFCAEGGRFRAPMCDWFVIGGRWSGRLQEVRLGKEYETAFEKHFPQFAGDTYSTDLTLKLKKRLNSLWRQFGGNGDNPIARSPYEELGQDDDAMLTDQLLYDRLLVKHEGLSQDSNESAPITFADLDDHQVDCSFISRKWLVIVDYHN